jgi:hypothetical protein
MDAQFRCAPAALSFCAQVDVEDESPSAVKEKAVLYETTPALAREQVCPPNPTKPNLLICVCGRHRSALPAQ